MKLTKEPLISYSFDRSTRTTVLINTRKGVIRIIELYFIINFRMKIKEMEHNAK